jgi:DNA polymerase III epsilon subunit-like protein
MVLQFGTEEALEFVKHFPPFKIPPFRIPPFSKRWNFKRWKKVDWNKIDIFFYIYIIRNKYILYKMPKICVFDTETSGLPPILDGKDWNERNVNDNKLLNFNDLYSSTSVWKKILSSWPSIIQLSYIIYDTESPNNSKIFNKYITIPHDVVIAETSIAIHHIDREKIKNEPTEKKALISNAVSEFLNDITDPEVITVVGHNVQFDRKMIIAELLRMNGGIGKFNETTEKQLQFLMDNKKFTCSMDVTAPICNIQIAVNYKDKKTGEDKVFYKVKSPKLIEAYQYYFGYSPDGHALHDALIDVILCLRVFMKYKYNENIYGKNSIITEFIKSISPEGYICNEEGFSNNVDIDIENIKLEIVDPFNEESKETNTESLTSISNNNNSKKNKQGSKKIKNKKQTGRRSKRLAILKKNLTF